MGGLGAGAELCLGLVCGGSGRGRDAAVRGAAGVNRFHGQLASQLLTNRLPKQAHQAQLSQRAQKTHARG